MTGRRLDIEQQVGQRPCPGIEANAFRLKPQSVGVGAYSLQAVWKLQSAS